MESETRARAEARLDSAASANGFADPRPPYRERLRQIRDADPAGFAHATRHYEDVVLPAIAAGDPLLAWLEYGRFLVAAGAPAAVRLMAIDATGRATDLEPPLRPHTLALFVPEDTARAPLIALAPVDPSAAQQATLDLLVHGRLG